MFCDAKTLHGGDNFLSMQTSVRDDLAMISPREKIVGTLAFITVAYTAWALAGKATSAPPIFTTMAALTAVVSVLLARRDRIAFHWAAFVPLAAFAVLVGASLFNLSYMPVPGVPGKWEWVQDWIKGLPSTVDRATTLKEVLPWLAAFLLGGALRQAAFDRMGVRWLWGALVIHGFLVAMVGVWFYFADNSLILGLYRDPYGYHFASFIYRNHWAAYVILLVTLALGFAMSALRRWRTERAGLDVVLPGIGLALLIALTLPMPGSRSGMVVVCLLFLGAFSYMGWVLVRTRGKGKSLAARWLPVLLLTGFLGLTIGAGVGLNVGGIQKHIKRTESQLRGLGDGEQDLRWKLTRDTTRMAMDRPVWGWGVGSFGIIFPKYQGDYLRDKNGLITGRVLNAHNDWAHMWAETGVIGMIVLVTPLVWLLRACWLSRGVLARWGGGAVVVILAYALVDFPLHCPAVFLLWITVLCTAAPPGVKLMAKRARPERTSRRVRGSGRERAQPGVQPM